MSNFNSAASMWAYSHSAAASTPAPTAKTQKYCKCSSKWYMLTITYYSISLMMYLAITLIAKIFTRIPPANVVQIVRAKKAASAATIKATVLLVKIKVSVLADNQ